MPNVRVRLALWWMPARLYASVVGCALWLASGCAQVAPADEFLFQTEAEKAAPDVLADADAPDTADAADVVGKTDVADTSDVTSDAVDAGTDAQVGDTADTQDAGDVADGTDTGDATDAADSPDTSVPPDGADTVATGDADAADASTPCVPLDCDDGDPCTSDTCTTATGCTHAPASGAVCALDKCHGSGTCVDGACKFTVAISCDDQNDCTFDSCDNTTGCVNTPLNNGACVGSACMVGQTCSAGVCQGGSAKVCNDGKLCTDDACVEGVGCTSTNNTAPCDDGVACTGPDACAAGACAGPTKFTDVTLGTAQAETVAQLRAVADGFALLGTTPVDGVDALWFARTDWAGKQVADVTLPGLGAMLAVDLAVQADGFWALAEANIGGTQGTDARLVQLDAQGKSLLDVSLGGPGDQHPHALLAGKSGLIVVGDTVVDAKPADAWVLLTDASAGNVLTRTYGGAGVDVFHAVAKQPTGLVLAGSTTSSGAGGADMWLVAVDATGKQLWEHTYGGAGEDVAQAVLVLPDGFLLAGTTTSKGAGTVDAWLVRTDADGNALWDRTYGGKNYDDALELYPAGDGYVFSGTTSSTGAGGAELWLVRVDALGNKAFGAPYGGTANDTGAHVAVLADGFALAGTTASKGAGSTDAWLMRTDLFGNPTCAGSGACTAKTLSDCADGTPCTTDLCDAAHTGCWHGGTDGFACDDGEKCTAPDTCVAKACIPGGPLNCDDGESCTIDSCDPEFGCVHNAAPAGPCNDGNACTTSDACVVGACVGSGALPCDDKQSCTSDACVAPGGCVFTPLADKVTCNDGDVCTVDDHCTSGICGGLANTCDDKNVCTTDSCTPGKGCDHTPNANTCDDGLPGTVNDQCGSGVCSGCDPNDVALEIDDFNVPRHICAPDYPRWGRTAVSPQTFVDQGDGTVLDSTTGLQWQQTISGTSVTFTIATQTCDTLSLATHTDWRLPTLQEIATSIDYTQQVPASPLALALGGGFQLWTTSPYAAQPGEHWLLSLDDGALLPSPGPFTAHFRCVRATVTGGTTTGRFVSNLINQTTLDTLTQLTWQRATTKSLTLADAASTCAALTTGGVTWRLPELPELVALVQPEAAVPALDHAAFVTDSVNWLWSATTTPNGTLHWTLQPGDGQTAVFAADATLDVRCVHTGNLCDDGNPCTVDTPKVDGTCKHVDAPDGAPCDDGDQCATNKACGGGVCGGGTAVTCTVDATCAPGLGCTCNPGYVGNGSVGGLCSCGGIVETVSTAAGDSHVCAYDWPAWGQRPSTPTTFVAQGDGTVVDTQTRLQWTQSTSGMLLFSSGTTYCQNLALAGHDDWRLPTLAELESLLDYAKSADKWASVFAPQTGTFFWSSIPRLHDGGASLWTVDFSTGKTWFWAPNFGLDTWCVRSNGPGFVTPSPRFNDNANGTITDFATGLVWQQFYQISHWGKIESAGTAQNFCAMLQSGGFAGGWRMPTTRELFTLIDRTKQHPPLDTTVWPSVIPDLWTSELAPDGTAYAVRMDEGETVSWPVDSDAFVKCVHD